MHPLCHPRDAPAGFQSPVECRRRVPRGESVYGAQAPRTSLLALRAGSVKACLPDRAGGAHIVRFLFGGDVAGLDALSSKAAEIDLVALEDSEVCVLPGYRELMRADCSGIASHLVDLLRIELRRAQAHATSLARLDAGARIALFLLDHAGAHARFSTHGALPLPMSRRELGEHLNLTIESTSRILCDFQAQGCIHLARGAVELLRLDALAARARSPGRSRISRVPEPTS